MSNSHEEYALNDARFPWPTDECNRDQLMAEAERRHSTERDDSDRDADMERRCKLWDE